MVKPIRRLKGKKIRPKPRPKPHRPQPHPTDGIPKRPRTPKPRRPAKHLPDPWSLLLASVPGLVDAIVWRAPGPAAQVNGVATPYRNWSQVQKLELRDAWARIVNGSHRPLSFTPKVGLTLDNGGELWSTKLSPQSAWKYFLAYVAQCLAIESRQSVPWSLRDYRAADLAYVLDSKSLFHYSSALLRYGVINQHSILDSLGASQPGDPVLTYQSLRTLSLVGADRRDTIDRMLDWCRSNLAHFYGSFAPKNLFAHWQYQGWPPIDRVLSGTTHPQFGFRHWTAGCWGTAGFLRNTLRTVNIPVSLEPRDGHALPHFHLPLAGGATRDLYLSHGDDPYNSGWISTPPVPIAELPIDDARFQSWFGPNAALPPGGTNVGRQTVELAIRYLSNYLLRLHCGDLAAGRSPAQSQVFDPQIGGLGRYYTVAELQAQMLWQRLDDKITTLGGCGNVPP
jgi:hypothetical protein